MQLWVFPLRRSCLLRRNLRLLNGLGINMVGDRDRWSDHAMQLNCEKLGGLRLGERAGGGYATMLVCDWGTKEETLRVFI